MRDAATLVESDSPASDPDAANPLLQRQLAVLGDLAEIGLKIARALEGQAKGTGPKVTEGDISLAYSRVARAIRQAILLQSRLLDDSKVRTTAAEKALADARGVAEEARQERENQVKCRISRIVERVAKAGRDDKEVVDRLVEDSNDCLDDDGVVGDVLSRPVSETVALICKGLGLDPDWTRLAQEVWAQEEVASGEAGWPLLPTSTIVPAMAGGGPSAGEPMVEGAGGRRYAAESPLRDSA